MSAPEAGRTLEEIAKPNPCADHLEPVKQTEMVNSFEDAEELASGAKGSATLGSFGFHADASRATHLLYKIHTQRRVSRVDMAGYDACCKEKGCGYGYIASLVYGDGEYSSAEETAVSAGVDIVTLANASGTHSIKVLHKRAVRGFIAAVVRKHDAAAANVGPLGSGTTAGVTEATVGEQVKAIYEREKINICTGRDPSNSSAPEGWFFCGATGAMPEGAFAEKFRTLTSSPELQDLEGRRNTGAMITYGVFALAGAGALVYGFSKVITKQSDEPMNVGAAISLPLGGLAFLIGGVGFIMTAGQPYGALNPNTDHKLTEYDGRLYADRYNRLLLRRTARDVERAHATTSLVRSLPTIGYQSLPGGGAFSVGFAF